jgi:hypothetical protein
MEGMGNLELESAQLTMFFFFFGRYIVEFGGEIQKYLVMNLF